jgi:excisionase family DNA binding protein
MQNYTKTIITAALKLDGNYSPEQICAALKLIDGHKPDDRDPPLLLTIAEVARLISVSRQTVWRLVQEGVLTKVTIKGSSRYRRSDILNLIIKGT